VDVFFVELRGIMGNVTKFPRLRPRVKYRLLDNAVFDIVKIAGIYNRSATRFYERHFGLSLPQVRVLNVVGHRQPVSPADVVEAALMDKALVSRTVTKLMTIGLLTRDDDGEDGRRQILMLSKAGRRVWTGILQAKQRRHDGFLASLTDEEIHQLVGLLTRLEADAERVEQEEAAADRETIEVSERRRTALPRLKPPR